MMTISNAGGQVYKLGQYNLLLVRRIFENKIVADISNGLIIFATVCIYMYS